MAYKQVSIITKRWRDRKPPLGSQINWGHPLSKGLVGCWLMNEGGGNVVSDIARKNNGTLPSSGITWGYKKSGIVLNFTATNNINLGTPTILAPTTPFSVTAWVSRSGNIVGNDGIISSKTDTSGNLGWLLYANSTANKARFLAAGVVAESNSAIPLNTLTHLVGVWNGTKVLLYVNGVLQTTQGSGTSQPYYSGVSARIGQYSVFEKWAGYISSISFYNRALSPSEIQSLYVEPYQMIQPIRRRVFVSIPAITSLPVGSIRGVKSIRGISRVRI